ncbi:MAG: hypothetical protein GYB65_01765 [Chloroflexi bacterium]|nr:hypothetical protein [Chloroflexota bacterium]
MNQAADAFRRFGFVLATLQEFCSQVALGLRLLCTILSSVHIEKAIHSTMKITPTISVFLFVLLCGGGVAFAQPGGQGGDNPTPAVPTLPPGYYDDATIIAPFQNIPRLAEFELDNFAATYGESNPEAAAAITNFAATHLGAEIVPVYAQKPTGILAGGTIPDVILNELPEDVQALYADLEASGLDGATYYAVLEDGLAMVITEQDCAGLNCTVDADDLQVNIEEASLGVYILYNEQPVGSSDAAYDLVVANFPALQGVPLEALPPGTTYTYPFSAVDTSLTGGTAYFARVADWEDTAVVYVITAVGEGYIGFGQWGAVG